MTWQPVAASARMFCANCACEGPAVAKASVASGARSWMISSMAVPSSPFPAWPASTSTSAGSSPLACTTGSEFTPSDSTQTLTPMPVTPKMARASSTPCVMSPSETRTGIWLVIPSTGRLTRLTAGRAASGSRSSKRTRAVMTR